MSHNNDKTIIIYYLTNTTFFLKGKYHLTTKIIITAQPRCKKKYLNNYIIQRKRQLANNKNLSMR